MTGIIEGTNRSQGGGFSRFLLVEFQDGEAARVSRFGFSTRACSILRYVTLADVTIR